MKNTILIIALILSSLLAGATEKPDSFTCFSDRKVEILPDTAYFPWKDRNILMVFDYDNKNMKVFARETLTLTMGRVGAHYYMPSGEGAVDIEAVDHLGRRVVCTLIIREGERNPCRVLVVYANVVLEYKTEKLRK